MPGLKFITSVGLEIFEEDQNLPHLCWTPKFHKLPYKRWFIADFIFKYFLSSQVTNCFSFYFKETLTDFLDQIFLELFQFEARLLF